MTTLFVICRAATVNQVVVGTGILTDLIHVHIKFEQGNNTSKMKDEEENQSQKYIADVKYMNKLEYNK